jgi:hypothetical protein
LGCERLRLPHHLDKRLTDGGKVVSPTHRKMKPDINASFVPKVQLLIIKQSTTCKTRFAVYTHKHSAKWVT